MMDPIIAVFLRSDVSWGSLSEDSYLEQEKFNRSVIRINPARKRELLTKIKFWNQTFSMSWFEYRQRIKNIAELNRSQIHNVDLVIRNRHQAALLERLDNVIILPVDDDDWFSPEIADTLRKNASDMPDLFSWSDGVFCPSRKVPVKRRQRDTGGSDSLFFRNPTENGFWTNGYAVSEAGLDRCPDENREDVLNRHAKVLATFKEHVPEFRHRHLDQVLSITHKSNASFTKLLTINSSEDLLAHRENLATPTELIPPKVKWAEPFIRQVDELNLQLVRGIRHASAPATSDKSQHLWSGQTLTRTAVINGIIDHAAYSAYLEIGCGNNQNFTSVTSAAKTGVDPNRGGTTRKTSDEFFKSNRDRFDLVFVDGLHLEEQVLRDVENSLRYLNEGGCILIHDCLPSKEVHQERERTTGAWFGDVWKAVARLRTRPDLDIAVLDACCGMGALFVRPNSDRLTDLPELTWHTYAREKHRLLRVMDATAFSGFVTGH